MALEDWLLTHARVSSREHRKVTLEDKMAFFQQLATLVSSGTQLLQAIQLAARQSQSTQMRRILEEVAGHVAGGCSLRDALANYTKIFDEQWIGLIGTAEVSGKMGAVLRDLNQQIRESYETRRKVVGALVYPVILLVVALLVVIIMLWVVVPSFADMFQEMGAELPGITRCVMSASDFIVAYGMYIILAGVILALAFRHYLQSESGRRWVCAAGLATPFVGELMVQSAMYRFSSNLALLLNSGVPMLETLSALAAVFRKSPLYRHAILRVQNRVAAGHSLADSLEETELFTTMTTNMVRLGEESAQLAGMMEQIAPYYRDKLYSFISRATKLMEPAIILVMGTTIAGLMLAVYLPMFEMAGNAK